jgi:hypothetical protein
VLADLLFYGVVGAIVCLGGYLGWRGIEALAVIWMDARARRSGAGFVPSPPVRMQPGRLDARPRSILDRPRLSVLPQPDSRVVPLTRRASGLSAPVAARLDRQLERAQKARGVSPFGIGPFSGGAA